MASFSKKLSRRIALASVLLGALTLSGCGDSYGKVTGKVTYKGAALKGGIVTFAHVDGKPSETAQINEDGTYTIAKVVTGNVKICVDTSSFKPKSAPKQFKYSPPSGQSAPESFQSGEDPEVRAKRYVWIPETYASPDKTDLTYTVTAGDQEKNIELK